MMKAKQVLIIDDDEGIRQGLETLLSDEGYTIHCAENGQEALDFLSQSRPLPSFILLDLMMPVMDGITFSGEKQKRPELSSIPTVVLTAGAITEKVLALPAIARIRKPVDIDHLLEVLAHHV